MKLSLSLLSVVFYHKGFRVNMMFFSSFMYFIIVPLISLCLLSFALNRKFRNYDVSTNILKLAPDFCSVYVISKGKVASVRSAQRPVVNTAMPPKLSYLKGLPPLQDHPDNEEGSIRCVKLSTLQNAKVCWIWV